MTLSSLLGRAERAGTHRLPADRAEELRQAARAAGLRVFEVQLDGITDVPGFLDAVAAALDFPDWFGRNVDALVDCLTDLSWTPGPGYVLMLHDPAQLAHAVPERFAALMDALTDVVDTWREDDVPFWILADLPSLPAMPDSP